MLTNCKTQRCAAVASATRPSGGRQRQHLGQSVATLPDAAATREAADAAARADGFCDAEHAFWSRDGRLFGGL